MNLKSELQELQQVLSSSQSVLIIIPSNPSLDKVAAALSLYLSLEKNGKITTIVCSQPMTVEFSQLVGVDKITNRVGGKNLVISFDYVKDSIEKVSYNVENDKFNLVIQPKTGLPSLDAKKVTYSYSGTESDLIFVIGAQKLEDLGRFYEDEKESHSHKQVINIDYHQQNSKFGKLNIFNPQASSCSEIIALALKVLNLPFDKDIAVNLFIGIKSATSNFQSLNLSAEAFEAAALCFRAGAKQVEGKKISSPSSDWLTPKIYKGTTRV
mgnify:CR=1 FL=1